MFHLSKRSTDAMLRAEFGKILNILDCGLHPG